MADLILDKDLIDELLGDPIHGVYMPGAENIPQLLKAQIRQVLEWLEPIVLITDDEGVSWAAILWKKMEQLKQEVAK